jgi:hypothetical protein
VLTSCNPRATLDDAYRSVSRLADGLSAPDFLLPTRCAAWTVEDVLFHLLRDAQRALVALASPADGPADVDFVTYWRPFSAADPDALVHARAVRIAAASFPTPGSLVATWVETSDAALRSAGRAGDADRITTQGHVLSVLDFLATLAVEATVHYTDMTVHSPAAEPPTAASLRLVRQTLDGLLGTGLPTGWSDPEYLLKGTGRLPLGAADHSALRELGAKFPLFS